MENRSDLFSNERNPGGPGNPGGLGGPGNPGSGTQNDGTQTVKNEFSTVRNFWSSRDTNAKKHLQNYLSGKISSQTCTVTVENPAAKGSVQLNTLKNLTFANGSWSGTYPTDSVLTLQAEAAEGYTFLRWEITGAEYESGSAASASVKILPTENQITVKAVFEEGEAPVYTYDAADVRKLQAYLLTTGTLTAQEAAKYDIDRSGTLNASDLTQMKAKLIRK